MKKIISAIPFFLLFLMATPVAVQAQDMARVTVTIKSLGAASSNSWEGNTEVYAKIIIGGKIKKFPVYKGRPVRNLNWQFTTTTSSSTANIRIEAWEYDALFEGGDDIVCVDGESNTISKTISTMEIYNVDFHSRGGCTGSGKESGAISYNITIEPTRTAYLIQGIWKQVKYEIKRGTEEWHLPSGPPECEADDLRIFRKNATYTVYYGADKCGLSDAASNTANWNFQNNDTKLQLYIPGGPITFIYTVHWIDKTKMILSTSTNFGGGTLYQRYTYGH
jgi:hypothetical protein